jgi:hypothetical protein
MAGPVQSLSRRARRPSDGSARLLHADAVTTPRIDARSTRIAAVALVLALAGCAPAPKPYAAATTPPPADPVMQRAQAECADLATRQTQNVSPQSQASKAAVGIYYKCMADKGYPPPKQ